MPARPPPLDHGDPVLGLLFGLLGSLPVWGVAAGALAVLL
jgi:hypothetical protein